jgi:hypothetical protein
MTQYRCDESFQVPYIDRGRMVFFCHYLPGFTLRLSLSTTLSTSLRCNAIVTRYR